MKQLGRCFILVLALVCILRTANAQQTARDGNWWRTLDYPGKLAYLIGYIDGATWVAVYKKTGNPFLHDAAPPQLARELDAYYENPRNRHRHLVLVINDFNAKER